MQIVSYQNGKEKLYSQLILSERSQGLEGLTVMKGRSNGRKKRKEIGRNQKGR